MGVRRRWVGLGLTVIMLASLLTGCDGRADVSAQIRESIPAIARSDEVATMADLRGLADPSTALRGRFTSAGEVYRVIDASVDRARIAIWRTAAPGPEPFNANRLATGTACASLERRGELVTATAIDCPYPVATGQPTAEVASWGHDAGAVALAQLGAGRVNDDLRWLLFRNRDGTSPRHDPVDATAIADTIHRTMDQPITSSTGTAVTATVANLARRGHRVTGVVRIAASAPGETNTAETTTATGCFALDVDLTIRSADQYENWLPLRAARC